MKHLKLYENKEDDRLYWTLKAMDNYTESFGVDVKLELMSDGGGYLRKLENNARIFKFKNVEELQQKVLGKYLDFASMDNPPDWFKIYKKK